MQPCTSSPVYPTDILSLYRVSECWAATRFVSSLRTVQLSASTFASSTVLAHFLMTFSVCVAICLQFKAIFEVDGDTVNPIEKLAMRPDYGDDSEDISAELALLPLVQVDPSKHFAKKGKYRSEVYNLLKCQGGACPGSRLSPHVIQLLGRSPDGQLVFEKLLPRYLVLWRFYSISFRG